MWSDFRLTEFTLSTSKIPKRSWCNTLSAICDAIKGNQLELEQVTFSVFYVIEVLILRGTFCWKIHLNRSSGSKVMSNWKILRTIQNNRNSFFFWLYLTINAQNFRLIPLDRNAYVFWYTSRCVLYTHLMCLQFWQPM